jgi:hypothetical protein
MFKLSNFAVLNSRIKFGQVHKNQFVMLQLRYVFNHSACFFNAFQEYFKQAVC